MSLDNTSPLSLQIVWKRGINYKRIQISFENNVLLHKYIGLIEQLVSNLDVPVAKLDIRYSHLDGQFLRYKSYMDNCFKVVKITGTCCRKTEKVKILTEKNEVIWLISNISNYWLRFPDGVFTHSRKDGYFKFMFKPCVNNQIANTRMKRRLDPVLEVATRIDELELNEGASDSDIKSNETTDESVYSGSNKPSEIQSIETVELESKYNEDEKLCTSAATTINTIVTSSYSPTDI